jgi:hypothetical protein
MKRLCASLILLAAAACAPMDWTRTDAPADVRDGDLRACREQAWHEAGYLSLGWPYFRGPFAYDPFGRSLTAPYYSPFTDPHGQRFFDEARLTDFCMRAKGYDLAPVTR